MHLVPSSDFPLCDISFKLINSNVRSLMSPSNTLFNFPNFLQSHKIRISRFAAERPWSEQKWKGEWIRKRWWKKTQFSSHSQFSPFKLTFQFSEPFPHNRKQITIHFFFAAFCMSQHSLLNQRWRAKVQNESHFYTNPASCTFQHRLNWLNKVSTFL